MDEQRKNCGTPSIPQVIAVNINLSQQEVKNIHAGAALSLVKLRVATLIAGDCNKSFILNIHQLGNAAAGCLKLV